MAPPAGTRLAAFGKAGSSLRTFLGVAVGASITPGVVAGLPGMAVSLAFVPVFILVIGAVGYPLFRRGFGFDHPTSWYAAMPGGLQDMILFGQQAGGDVRALSLIHATRVLAIITLAPILMGMIWQVDLTRAPGQPAAEMDPVQIGLMLACGLAGWKIAERLRLFGASILGPMILTAAASLSGLIDQRPPAEMIWAAQLFIGLSVGVKYTGITAREIRVDVGAGLVYAAFLALISIAFIEAIALTGTAPPLDAFLAFLPGGQAEMVVIAILAGADLAYVVSHHLLRLVLVITLAPLAARIFGRGG
ncbi:MAG TPA: AbrB family transcriptional regulator [Paracoccaceae bacterium]|nr:AbrB family transcriptional regulator [Paracoccaceae bacterium]